MVLKSRQRLDYAHLMPVLQSPKGQVHSRLQLHSRGTQSPQQFHTLAHHTSHTRTGSDLVPRKGMIRSKRKVLISRTMIWWFSGPSTRVTTRPGISGIGFGVRKTPSWKVCALIVASYLTCLYFRFFIYKVRLIMSASQDSWG